MQSKNDRQENIIETQSSLISRCTSIISMDISTGWLKSDIYTLIHRYIHEYPYPQQACQHCNNRETRIMQRNNSLAFNLFASSSILVAFWCCLSFFHSIHSSTWRIKNVNYSHAARRIRGENICWKEIIILTLLSYRFDVFAYRTPANSCINFIMCKNCDIFLF